MIAWRELSFPEDCNGIVGIAGYAEPGLSSRQLYITPLSMPVMIDGHFFQASQ
jgi:hypothetical protein